jgi:hypothetical protein
MWTFFLVTLAITTNSSTSVKPIRTLRERTTDYTLRISVLTAIVQW